MKNMKIKVETDEHGESNLDEIVGELERLGYVKIFGGDGFGAKTIESYMDGTFDAWIQSDKYNTTLAELKEMNKC